MQPDEIVRKILTARGITKEEDVREFLSEKPVLVHDPLLLPGAEAGADFLLGALSRGERVCVYGDYDVDGICGTALLTSFLRETARALGGGSTVTYYIPSRIDEGYGLNKSAIRTIREGGSDIIVTVDCGSVSVEEAAYARETGLEIVITDHHDPDKGRSPDCIHINPKLRPETGAYPFESLSGAGVAFKLCGALMARAEAGAKAGSLRFAQDIVQGFVQDAEGESAPDDYETPGALKALRAKLRSCVDLVCVATIADVMPIVDENRTIVKYGFQMLKAGRRMAFRELLAVSGIDPARLDVYGIAFGIAPRLNAIGRLGDASEGVELFLTEDENRIRGIVRRLDVLNVERRRLQDNCFQECMSLYNSDLDAGGKPRRPFLLLRPGNVHEGVAGIVAGKVHDETRLPCAVLSETQSEAQAQEEGMFFKGSARGGNGRFDLISFLRRYESLFERLGGHAGAAGFMIRAENEKPLREALSRDLAEALEAEPDLFEERKSAELEIGHDDITPALARAIEKLAPFGNGNPKPALSLHVSPGEVAGFRRLGREKNHLRFTAKGIPCVFFWGAGTVFPETGPIRIIGCPEINEWNGYGVSTPQSPPGGNNIQFAVTCVDML